MPSASLITRRPDAAVHRRGHGAVHPVPDRSQRPRRAPRATSVQKCVRTLDIEEVGKTTRHGTFFQMNGNFSFGDYFKEGAIAYAWELITRSQADGGFGIDPEMIWVTVYLDDDEAAALWHAHRGVPAERIQRRGQGRQLLVHGRPGPGRALLARSTSTGARSTAPRAARSSTRTGTSRSGTWSSCSTSRGGRRQGRLPDPRRPAQEEHRHRHGPGTRRLPAAGRRQHVRDRRGRARSCDRAAELAGVTYGAVPTTPTTCGCASSPTTCAAALMLIGDGVTPGNEGRGYVLRRLLRRAVRSMRLLGVDEARLPELLPIARDCMSASYPELASDFDRISDIAYAEEEAFRRTLRPGRRSSTPRCARPDGRRRHALRRPGLLAARHVRLPHRPDPRDGHRAGLDRRPRTASRG